MSELVIIFFFFTAIIFMYATGLMGGIPKLLKLVEQEDFDTFEFDCKKHKVAYEALLEHEEGDDLKIDLLFEHVYTAYTLKEVQAKLTEVLITQCPTASSTTASSTTASSTTAASTTASSTTASSTTASSTTAASTTASSTTPATTTPATTTASSTTPATISTDTGTCTLGYRNHPGMDGGGTANRGFHINHPEAAQGTLTPEMCQLFCKIDTACGGFTFRDNSVNGSMVGDCFPKGTDMIITALHRSLREDQFSTYQKCQTLPSSPDGSTLVPKLHRYDVNNYQITNNIIMSDGMISRDDLATFDWSPNGYIIGLMEVKIKVFYDKTKIDLDVVRSPLSLLWDDVRREEFNYGTEITVSYNGDLDFGEPENLLIGTVFLQLKWVPSDGQGYEEDYLKNYIDESVTYNLVSITTANNDDLATANWEVNGS
jgi:hypothetical protein